MTLVRGFINHALWARVSDEVQVSPGEGEDIDDPRH